MRNKLRLVVDNGKTEKKTDKQRHLKAAPDSLDRASSVIRIFASSLIDHEMPFEDREMLAQEINEAEVIASITMLSAQMAFELYRDLSIAANLGSSLIRLAALKKLSELDHLFERP